jgi:hypothetical protein
MKRLQRALIFICLIFLSAVLIKAQGGSSPSAPKHKFKHNARIFSGYKKATDQTIVMMYWYRVTDLTTDSPILLERKYPYIAIGAAFGYPGRFLKSTAVAIEFNIKTDYEGHSLFKGKEMPELTATIDGKSISLGKLSLQVSKTLVPTLSRPLLVTSEVLMTTFTYEGLLRLTNAKKVMMKIGRLEFQLHEGHLEALRDFLSRMVPQ